MLTATAHFPYSLYRLATPLRLRPELAAAAQLGRLNLAPSDIGTILISHFHADHIAGLADFPTSRFVALREAYGSVANIRGLAGPAPRLHPQPAAARLPPRASPCSTPSPAPRCPALGATYDYYGDGSLLLVRLPGHARGQVGLLANTDRGPIFFVADSCWLAQSVRENRPPSRIGGLIADNTGELAATIAGLHTFAAARPDVLIVPSHCPETFAQVVAN